MAVFEVNENLYGIDLMEENRPERSSAYVIRCSEPILVETGSARSHDALIEGLRELSINPGEIRHVVITHVHLDHAGGVGQMMEVAPKAFLHCHKKAARHMIDPSRLEAGARAVYQDQMDAMFGSLVPVPESRVRVQEDGSVLDVGDRRLLFYDAPGHANHHTCVMDAKTRGLFSGDAVGVRYVPGYTGWSFDYGFPTTSPTDFDPELMLETLDRLESLNLSHIYHTHFGVTQDASQAFEFCRRGIRAIQSMLPKISPDTAVADVEEQLRAIMVRDLTRLGHPNMDVSPLNLDIMLNSQGILAYLQKQTKAQ